MGHVVHDAVLHARLARGVLLFPVTLRARVLIASHGSSRSCTRRRPLSPPVCRLCVCVRGTFLCVHARAAPVCVVCVL